MIVTPLDRIALASKLFCLCAALGLSTLTRDLAAVQYTLILAAVVMTGWWLSSAIGLRHAWVAVAEGCFVGLLVGLALSGHPQLVPYLIAPTLVAGLAGGLFPLLLALLGQTVGLLLTTDIFSADAISERVTYVAPWLIVSLGSGLLGAWLREIGLGPKPPSADQAYELARRLVNQLRTVARRLPSGLDPVGIAGLVPKLIADEIDVSAVAVLVNTGGGLLSPLAHHGTNARQALNHDDPLTSSCWAGCEPIAAPLPGAKRNGPASHRLALPLRVGSRMIGVVLSDVYKVPDSLALRRLMRALDDTSLRLDTALTFGEIRTIATVEERNRLAREIHDGIAQELASVGYVVDDIQAQVDDSRVSARLSELRTEVTRIISDLRLSIFDLRSGVETGTSLGTALSDYVQQIGARSNMTVHLTLDESPTRLRGDVETELLRITQEAVTNARKHARASNLFVDCRVDPPAAKITVRDDGNGAITPREGRSFGLDIMHERAARIGAKLAITQGCGGQTGTTVTVEVGG